MKYSIVLVKSVKDSDVISEDGGQFKCVDIGEEQPFHVKLCSWDEDIKHKIFNNIVGHRIEVTVTIID